MKKRIRKLEEYIELMKPCQKFHNIEKCVCYYYAFNILRKEVEEIERQISALPKEVNISFRKVKKEVQEVCGKFTEDTKKCFECKVCLAHTIFEAYPEHLDELYVQGKL